MVHVNRTAASIFLVLLEHTHTHPNLWTLNEIANKVVNMSAKGR